MTERHPERSESDAPTFGERTRPEFGEYATPEEQRASIKATIPAGGGAAASDPPVAQSPRDRDGIPAWRDRDDAGASPHDDAPAPMPALSRSRTADRVATFALLGMGLYSTVNGLFAFGDFGTGLENGFRVTLGSDYVAPGWAQPVGLVLGAVFVILWAAALLVSMHRLRTGRITFWVPLAAGAIAVLAVGIPVFVAGASSMVASG